MPTYEYRCKDCGTTIEVNMSMEEKAQGPTITCAKCGSTKLTQVFGGFSMINIKKSGGGCGCGGGCGN